MTAARERGREAGYDTAEYMDRMEAGEPEVSLYRYKRSDGTVRDYVRGFRSGVRQYFHEIGEEAQ